MSEPRSACQGDALTTASFETHLSPLSIYSGIFPTTMIDLTLFVDRAIADVSHPRSPLTPIIFAELDRARILAGTVTGGA
jgi:hypothetical protein